MLLLTNIGKPLSYEVVLSYYAGSKQFKQQIRWGRFELNMCCTWYLLKKYASKHNAYIYLLRYVSFAIYVDPNTAPKLSGGDVIILNSWLILCSFCPMEANDAAHFFYENGQIFVRWSKLGHRLVQSIRDLLSYVPSRPSELVLLDRWLHRIFMVLVSPRYNFWFSEWN